MTVNVRQVKDVFCILLSEPLFVTSIVFSTTLPEPWIRSNNEPGNYSYLRAFFISQVPPLTSCQTYFHFEEERTCPEPPELENGSYQSDDAKYTPGSMVTYHCNGNYGSDP